MSGVGRVVLGVGLALAASLFVGLSFYRLGFWAIVGVLVAVAATIFLFSSPRALVLLVFVANPLIDMLWFARVGVGGMNLNPQSILSVVVLFGSLMFLVVRRVGADRALLAPVIAFMLSNFWALAVTPGHGFAAQYLIRLVCGLPLLFVVPAIVQDLPSPKTLMKWFFAVMALVCVTVMLQPLGLMAYTSFDSPGVGRATGFYYHPWDIARYLVILVPLLLVAVDTPGARKITKTWPYWLLLALALASTYFTFLKAAWIAVAIQLLLWLVLTGRARTAFVLLTASVLLVAFPFRHGFESVFSDLWKLSNAQTRGQALSGRVYLWGEYWRGLQTARLDDIILGQGYQPIGLGATNRATHDDYLRLLVMNGIAGVLAYLWLVVAVIRSLRRAVRDLSESGGIEWRLGLAVGCIFAAYLLMGITADPSSYPSLTLYLWLLVGLVVGYARVKMGQLEQVEP